jgi:uncharacterized Zn-finger protein
LLLAPVVLPKATPVNSPTADKTQVNTQVNTQANAQANAQQQYSVTRAELPLACPSPAMALWNSHPRVFLQVEKTGLAKCPYCGAEYTLVG